MSHGDVHALEGRPGLIDRKGGTAQHNTTQRETCTGSACRVEHGQDEDPQPRVDEHPVAAQPVVPLRRAAGGTAGEDAWGGGP